VQMHDSICVLGDLGIVGHQDDSETSYHGQGTMSNRVNK
jgi:hypothetical protein